MKEDTSQSTIKSIMLLWPYSKNYKGYMVVNGVSSILYAAFSILVSFIVKSLTDYAISRQMDLFYIVMVIAIITVILFSFIRFIQLYTQERYNMLMIRDIQNTATKHIQALPLSYIESNHSGNIVSRLNNDTKEISNLLNNILGIFYHPFVFMGALTYMLIISPKLIVATVFLIPISAIVFNKVSKPIEAKSKKLMEQKAKINEVTQDTLNGIHVMKSFNLEDKLYEKYEKNVQQAVSKSLEIQKFKAILSPIFLILRFIPQLVLPLYGGYLAMENEITIGELLAANMIIWSIFLPIESLLDLLQKIRLGVPAVRRIHEIIDYPKESFGNNELTFITKDIPVQLENVQFSYDNDKFILDNINLSLLNGKVTALVGASGSGKSTILKLLFGFYKQQNGNIYLYGQKYNNIEISNIRGQLSYVSQDSYIFPKTIKENIAYGRQSATMDEIIEAAKVANAHEFIMKLPNQYHTKIGQEGNRLSGGQRQRISIARAILKDAPILLLDEPTSALDNETEALVQEALNKIMKGKTVLVVAHRLSTIRDADEVLVIDQGNIVERGSHETLMKECIIYKKLYQNQFASSEGEGQNVYKK